MMIGEELTHVGCYLEIQQLRWEEGLEYEVIAAQEVQKLYIPKMTLQPFVENSMIHGFNSRQSGRILIKVAEEGERIRIIIEDDGIGLSYNQDKGNNRRRGGYGIRNVRERFSAYFGEEFDISLADGERGGTIVTIAFPRLIEAPGRSEV